jgi:hypothetical protein
MGLRQERDSFATVTIQTSRESVELLSRQFRKRGQLRALCRLPFALLLVGIGLHGRGHSQSRAPKIGVAQVGVTDNTNERPCRAIVRDRRPVCMAVGRRSEICVLWNHPHGVDSVGTWPDKIRRDAAEKSPQD